MFIVIGVIGVLWFVGFVVTPDKNQPPMSQANPPAAVATVAPTPSAPAAPVSRQP